jgi:cytochrome c553
MYDRLYYPTEEIALMKKCKITVLLTSLVALLLLGVSAVHAEKTTRPGLGKTAHCEACHGDYGCASLTGLMPKLCGQNQEYLVMTLEQFRDGSRPSPIMREITKSLSDKLIRQLAIYFANAPTSAK